MLDAQPSLRYQVGGSLAADAPFYVKRQADDALFDALQQGEFCYVLNARQMGKSSLLVQTLKRLRQQHICVLALDLTTLGNRQITAEQWYASLIHALAEGAGLTFDLMAWWEEVAALSLIKRLDLFLDKVLLAQVQAPIVIFLDEIDTVLGLEFCSDDFFALLRTCYNRRSVQPAYQRLTFALLGVAIPSDLIADKRLTPFNIGQAIALDGFTFVEAQPLLRGLAPWLDDPERVLREILAWTQGQPFLTQKLCALVVMAQAEGESFEQRRSPSVDSLVQRYLLANWESQDTPEHLKTIRNRLLYDPKTRVGVLERYREILLAMPRADGSAEQLLLELSGLIVNDQGQLRVKNRIYGEVFDLAWVKAQLAALRPYADALEDWVQSGFRDAHCLLEGDRLRRTLAWADGHRLGALDYRFLQASQQRAQTAIERRLDDETTRHQYTQIALRAAEQASQVLAQARRLARQECPREVNWGWCLGVVLGVLGGVGGLRMGGGLQALEWQTLDRFVQLRPQAPISSRVVLVTLDEPDIQALGQFPVSDELLALLLRRIQQQQPRLIGLDIYRDLPVEPGHDALNRVFNETSNLIGIEKVVGTPIAPPKGLAVEGRIGLADQLLDGDGTVRRGLLSVLSRESNGQRDRLRPESSQLESSQSESSPPEVLQLSFPLRLALDYLSAEQIEPVTLPGPSGEMQLGRAVLSPFQSSDGGYVGADDGGYQILLNYRRDSSQFPRYSFRDVLGGEVPAEALRDRIVLIGVTAPTVNDLVLTPYSRSWRGPVTQTPAVVVHANLISQLLDAALDGQPLLRVWPNWAEAVWIAAWIGLGAGLGVVLGHGRTGRVLWVLPLSWLGLSGLSFGAFLGGWWIPLLPAGLGGSVSLLALAGVTMRQAEQARLRLTVLALRSSYATDPAATQIALEYLKQSEPSDQRDWIEQLWLASIAPQGEG